MKSKILMLSLILTLFGTSAFAQESYQVNGKVTDAQGNALPGVVVYVLGTGNGTSTVENGTYTLNVRPVNGKATITFTAIGYKDENITVTGSRKLDVTMMDDIQTLEDVVVIGYGTQKKADITTAVSVVSTKDIDHQPVISASGILQGRAAGVQVVQPSGMPGNGMIVRVRGASSISSSNDPLFVVDGVPVGTGSDAISFLSPNDIETMQVLKDASSAAIYGSRAANGVVIITTKAGDKNRPPVISFNSYVGISNVSKTYNVLNVAQYKDLMDEMGIISLPDGLTDNTDWFDYTYRTGVNQNYQLSYSGSNNRTNYYVGGGWTREDGVIRTTYDERYNFKINMDTQIRDWINFSTNINYVHTDYDGIIEGTGSGRAGTVLAVINTPTYAKVWDEDNPDWYWTQFYGANITTPAEDIGRTKYDTNNNDRLIGTLGATITLAKNLTFKSTATMDRNWYSGTTFLDPIATSYGRTQHGQATATRTDDRRMVYDNILTYKLDLGKNHFEFMGGTSATVSHWEKLYGERTYFSDQYDNADISLNGGNNGGLRGQSQSTSEWTIMSYLSRLSYNFDERYLVTANIRADGSSKLSKGHRWGYFPSFSAAWRLSNEEFMKDIDWLNDLKIRAGWGQTGNQSGLDDYAYLQKYETIYYDWTDSDYAQATPVIGSRTNIKNDNLTWETTTQTNLGIDMTVLKNRLTLGLDLYYKVTTNMLMDIDLPDPNPDIQWNSGEMTNKGLEFTLSSRNISKKDFYWNTDFNISFNKNKLVSIDLQNVYYYAVTSEATSEYCIRMAPGESLSKFYGYVYEGVDPETGLCIYKDLDGNGKINSSDRQYIGDANPVFTAGMTNTIGWKNFTLSILMTGSYGNDIYNASKIEMEGMYTGANQITDVLRRWKIPGQITDIPKSNELYNLKCSSRFIEDGSFLKIKNINLSYSFETQKLAKWNISKIEPYISLQNFFTFTKYSGYDPEVSQYSSATEMGIDWGTYPHVKTAVFGINIDF
ncbi:MAG: TonB-dependent receptor [Bacteroidales bacterium]|jgi:TonB-linked SusC/RagA family outer membrane protein|nr:TonB-dependent receptor [Bacteroidales bacterium]MCI2121850.1 TonB-dependent receptor [Bacteroidales bacterium]MCI2145127.1 TonB-dependent receptor [Bacteroidales bacterium]